MALTRAMNRTPAFCAFLVLPWVAAAAQAVATFECAGIYHPSPDGSTCAVAYRTAGATEWKPALDLVYDARNQEHRGSIAGKKRIPI